MRGSIQVRAEVLRQREHAREVSIALHIAQLFGRVRRLRAALPVGDFVVERVRQVYDSAEKVHVETSCRISASYASARS